MRKRILSALLASAMLSALLAGCGGNDQGGENENDGNDVAEEQGGKENEDGEEQEGDSVRISDETITLTLAGPSGATAADWESSLQFVEYEKRLGIKFDATTYTNEQWDSRLTLMMASDEMPDILGMGNSPMSRSEVEQYAADGYLLDFSEYLDLMPNLTKYMEEYPEFAKSITLEDGGIYGFTFLNIRSDACFQNYILMSQTWLDNVGMEQPESLDDLYNVLTAFKEQDANGNGDPTDEIPMGMAGQSYYAAELPILWAYGINSTNYVLHLSADEETNEVGLWDTTENYKEFLKYMNRLYEEGLINEDAYIVDATEFHTAAKEGVYGYVGGSGSLPGTCQETMEWYQETGFSAEGYNEADTVVLNPRVNETFRFVANADTAYPEEIAKFVDYLFTNEGVWSGVNGYEGITFDFTEIAGYDVIDHNAYAEAADLSTGDYRNNIAIAPGAFSLLAINEGTIYDMLENIAYEELTNYEGDCWKNSTANALTQKAFRDNEIKIMDRFPTLYYTEEESQERATLHTDIENYLITMKAQFITGALDIDASWDDFLNQLNEMGLERYLEITQDAYDRYVAE